MTQTEYRRDSDMGRYDAAATDELMARPDRRNLSKTLIGGVGVVLAATLATGAIAYARRPAGETAHIVQADPADAEPTAEDEATSKWVTPKWLPEGAQLLRLEDDEDLEKTGAFRYGKAVDSTFFRSYYDFPDEKNASGPGTYRGTELSISLVDYKASYVPRADELEPYNLDSEYFNHKTIYLHGRPAVLTTSKNGYGAQRVDWFDTGTNTSYTVLWSREVGNGIIPTEDLVRVADSLYE